MDRGENGPAGRAGAEGLWEYLRRLGHTPQIPRPANAEADPQEQETFKESYPSV